MIDGISLPADDGSHYVPLPHRLDDSPIKPGIVFIPFHFAEAPANALTNSALDPVSKTPEYKVCAVKIEALP